VPHSTRNKLTETNLKQAIYKVLDKYFPGHYRRKFSGQFLAGCLDMVIIYQGRTVWLELKIYPNHLTPIQQNEIDKIRKSGGLAFCLVAKDDLTCFMLIDDRVMEATVNVIDLLAYDTIEEALRYLLIEAKQ